jgi:hypothetical protein
VLIAAEIAGTASACVAEAVRLSRHASVGIATLMPRFDESDRAASSDWAARLRRAAPNLIFARRLDFESLAGWSQAVIASRDQIVHSEPGVHELRCPVIALGEWERAAMGSDIPSLRAACDRLQRDLATLGQFAGYVV